MREKNFIKKTAEALALTGALLGAASAEAGGGGRIYETQDIVRLEKRAQHLLGKESTRKIRTADRHAQKELTERKKPEILTDIPSRAGTISREKFSQLLDLFPDNWFENEVRTVEFKDEYYLNEDGKEDTGTNAVWDRKARTITFYRPTKDKFPYEIFSIVSHEGVHSEDWLSSVNLNYGERLELAIATAEFNTAAGNPYDYKQEFPAYAHDSKFEFLTEVAAYTIGDFFEGNVSSESEEGKYAQRYLSFVSPNFDSVKARDAVIDLAGKISAVQPPSYQ